jgi:hypothetical protein
MVAPVKGEGLNVTTIDRTKKAELFIFFLIYSALPELEWRVRQPVGRRERA